MPRNLRPCFWLVAAVGLTLTAAVGVHAGDDSVTLLDKAVGQTSAAGSAQSGTSGVAQHPIAEGKPGDPFWGQNIHLYRIREVGTGRMAYVVRSGDQLWLIAYQAYGDPRQWLPIYRLNQAILGNANALAAGQKIEIPGLRTSTGTTAASSTQKPGETSQASQPAAGNGAFNAHLPLDHAYVSSKYGMRMHPILGYNKMHNGIDLSVPGGTPIKAAGDGTVVFSGWKSGYGNFVQIRHADGTLTNYAHIKQLKCRKGDKVKAGATIATVNSTGMSTGDHLHFEVMRNGRFLDPAKYFKFPPQGRKY